MPIRTAAPADLSAILKLERAAPTAGHWSQAQYEVIFNAPHSASRVVLVAEEGADLAGFLVARAASDEWEIENVVVSESARRRGFGSQLVFALLDSARRDRACSIFLEVRESNVSARALYEACGFQQSGRRPGYYDCPTEDAMLYALVFS
jgi:ribosomal-protein-alanine N-acetyltransferase